MRPFVNFDLDEASESLGLTGGADREMSRGGMLSVCFSGWRIASGDADYLSESRITTDFADYTFAYPKFSLKNRLELLFILLCISLS